MENVEIEVSQVFITNKIITILIINHILVNKVKTFLW